MLNMIPLERCHISRQAYNVTMHLTELDRVGLFPSSTAKSQNGAYRQSIISFLIFPHCTPSSREPYIPTTDSSVPNWWRKSH